MKPTDRILFVDIETLPRLGYYWEEKQPYNILKQVEDTSICSWSVKWFGGKQITRCLADYRGYKAGSRDDKKLMEELWPILDQAEVVVAHNGDRFDVKKINYRFMVHGMEPPSPYKTIDTLKEVKKVAAFDSHRLNELGRLLHVGEKLRTGGADLWFDCLEGDMKAWKHMKEYNTRDVYPLLEEVYLKLRPWMKNHPNLATQFGPDMCPKCGSTLLQSRGMWEGKTTAYRRFQCQMCKGWLRGTENFIKKEDKAYVSV